jgi:hypothetical protein
MSNVDLQITAENTLYLKGIPESVLRIRISGIHMFLGLPDPSASGFISQRNGSGFGSGSFYHQAKIVLVRKTLIPTVL